MRDDEREVQLFFAGSGQDFRRIGYGGAEHFGRLRTHVSLWLPIPNGSPWVPMGPHGSPLGTP